MKQKQIRMGDLRFREEITRKFSADLSKLVDGDRENWYDDVDGILAIIILLQFFTKIIYANDPRAYRFDEEVIYLSRAILKEE